MKNVYRVADPIMLRDAYIKKGEKIYWVDLNVTQVKENKEYGRYNDHVTNIFGVASLEEAINLVKEAEDCMDLNWSRISVWQRDSESYCTKEVEKGFIRYYK